MVTRLKPVLWASVFWPLLGGLGIALAANTRLGVVFAAGAGVVVFGLLAAGDLRVPTATLGAMVWGVFVANHSFANLGVGSVYIMDVLLGATVLGVMVNPVARSRLVAARLPAALLAVFLVLGALNLARGHVWGINAAKDSVLNFYAVAAIVPAGLFGTVEEALSFLRRCLPPLLVGAVLLSLEKVGSFAGVGTPEPFSFTPATAGAAVAAGFLFVVLVGRRMWWTAAVAGLLGLATVLSLARAVWLGAIIGFAVILLVSARDRRRVSSVLAATLLTAVAAATLLSFQGSAVLGVVNAKVSSIFFERSSATASLGIDPVGNNYWRLRVWRQTWDTRIQHSPLVGEGFGRPAVQGTPLGTVLHVDDPRVQVHNGYLSYLLREGAVGLAVFLALVGGALLRAVRTAVRSTDRARRTFALAVAGALCVYLVDLGLGVIIEGPMGGIPFWLLVGLAYVVHPLPRVGKARSAVRSSSSEPGVAGG